MTSVELIAAIDLINKNKLEDIEGRYKELYSHSCFYIVIKDDGLVIRHSSLTFIYEGKFKYAFLIIDYGYLSNSWSKNNWELVAFFTPNELLTSVAFQNWTLSNIEFGFTPHGYMAPIFCISINTDQTRIFKYDVRSDQFGLAWKYLLEIDANCITFEEAAFYVKYLKERNNRESKELAIEKYKAEISYKESIVNQYKDLLQLIDDKLRGAHNSNEQV